MAKRYTTEERKQALKLAAEIGTAAAARQLGINEDTLYSWQNRERKRAAAIQAEIGGRSKADLQMECDQLQAQLRQTQQTIQALQEALRSLGKPKTP